MSWLCMRTLAVALFLVVAVSCNVHPATYNGEWTLSPSISSPQLSGQTSNKQEKRRKDETCVVVVGSFDTNTTQHRACEHILANDDCQNTDAYGNYVNFLYCTLPGVKRVWAVLGGILLIIYMLYLFVIVGVAADDFFCPSLEVLSELLHMSQNIAGVTFLAFGNGAPDVFSSIAGVSVALTAEPTLSIGALLGGGFFVSSVVAGAVYISSPPFDMAQRPFLRDIVFYIGSVIWLMFILWRGSISQIESILFLVAYAVYALVVIVGRIVRVNWLKTATAIAPATDGENEANVAGILEGMKKHRTFEEEEQKLEDERRAVQLYMRPHTRFSRPNSRANSFRRGSHANVQRHRSNLEQQRRRLSVLSAQPPQTSSAADSTGAIQKLHHLSVPIFIQPRRASLPTIPASPLTTTTVPPSRQYELFTTSQEYDRERQNSPTDNPTILVIPATPNINSFLSSYHAGDDVDHGNKLENFPQQSCEESSIRRRPSSARQHYLTVPEITDVSPRVDNELAENDSADVERKTETPPFPPSAWWLDVLEHIWPMTTEYWNSLAWYARFWAVVKLPVQIVLLITVPLVDPAEPATRNWCKWLQTFQLAVSPILCVLVSAPTETIFKVVPLWTAVAAVSCTWAVILALTTRRDHVPRYHSLFSLVGFLVAVVWIYKTANEIVGVLTALGVAFRISPALLGLSLLAWGNSVPDFVADVALARQGFAGVGISACYAGPLFNILVGMGLSFAIATARMPSRVIKFHAGPVSILLCFSVLVVQALTLVGVPLQGFRIRKAFGIVLIGTYVALLSLLILTEVGVIRIRFPNH